MLKKQSYYLMFVLLLLISCQSSKSDKSTPHPHLESDQNDAETVLHQNQEQVSSEIQPCWIEQPPEQCSEYSSLLDEWILLSSHIEKENKTDALSGHDIDTLQNLLASELIQQLSITVLSELEETTQCKAGHCFTTINQLIHTRSKDLMNPDKIQIIDHYWQEKGSNQLKLWGIGKYRRSLYEQKLTIIKNQNLSPPGSQTVIFDEHPSVQSVDEVLSAQPAEEVLSKQSVDKVPSTQLINEQLKQVNLVELESKKIEYQTLPENLSTDQIISIIQNDFVNKRNSRTRDNIYHNHDVLDTDSIQTEYGVSFSIAELAIKKAFGVNKKIWQNNSKQMDFEYVNNIRDLLEQISSYKKKKDDLQELINRWKYAVKRIRILEQTHDTRKKYYDIQKTLINRYCLIFTIAFSEIREENIRFMLNQSDALAKTTILKDGLLKNIESKINIVDNYLTNTLKTSYRAKISLDYFGAITFMPEKYRGKLRKFKIELIEDKVRLAKGSKERLMDSTIAKSFIVVSSNEIMKINHNTCRNITQIQDQCFQKFEEALRLYPNIKLEDSEKNKTQYLINEVINDNCHAQVQTLKNKKNKEKELTGILEDIHIEEEKIFEINKQLKAQHNITIELPIKIKNINMESPLPVEYENKYNTNITRLRKELEKISRIQTVVALILVEGPTDYNKIDVNIKGRIRENINDNIPTFCPEVNWGEQLVHDQEVQRTEHISNAPTPKIRAYDIPQITILPVQKTNYAECTVPVFLKIDCISRSKTFAYHKKMNAIEDTGTKYLWQISQSSRIFKRKHAKDSFFQYSQNITDDHALQQFFLDYQEFCHSYISYRSSWSHIDTLPDIHCVHRFEMVDDNSFYDNLRYDHWRVIPDKYTYIDLVMNIKNSDWMINSFQSLQRLFFEMKDSSENNDVNIKLIQLLSNKSFWTNTSIDSTRKSVAIFDFSQNDLLENAHMTDEMIFGIVKRKFSDFR